MDVRPISFLSRPLSIKYLDPLIHLLAVVISLALIEAESPKVPVEVGCVDTPVWVDSFGGVMDVPK